MRTKEYYDEFAAWYEKERGRGYHQLIDDLEIELVERYGAGGAVLEAGCGTGLLLERTAGFAREAWGFDLSAGMLAKARQRGLGVVQGSITDIPFPDARFDLVYSFKVLAHVEDIRRACAEMARVTKPGGKLLLEFYNPLSFRGLIKKLKPPSAISERTSDEAVFTRYDLPKQAAGYLPAGCRLVDIRGVRVVTPVSHVYRVPQLGRIFSRLEHLAADAPILKHLGGFVILIVEKGAA